MSASTQFNNRDLFFNSKWRKAEIRVELATALKVSHLKNKVRHCQFWINDSLHLAHDSPHKLFFTIALPNTISTVYTAALLFVLMSALKIPYGIFRSKHFICATGSSNGIQF